MEKFWKITNISTQQIKVGVSIKSHVAPGVLLNIGQFCISRAQMTTPLDAQVKRRFLTIEDFDNSEYGLKLAKSYDAKVLEKKQEPVLEVEDVIIEPAEFILNLDNVYDQLKSEESFKTILDLDNICDQLKSNEPIIEENAFEKETILERAKKDTKTYREENTQK